MSHGGGEIEVPHDDHDPFTKKVAFSVAIYAVILAVAGLGAKNAGKDMISDQISASNRWSQYQAKSVREFMAENEYEKTEVEQFKLDEKPEAMEKVQKNRDRLKKKLEKYEKDKEEIKGIAEKYEHSRDVAHKKDNYFDYAELLLQIAIVLASIAMLSKAKWPWFTSMVLVAIALVLTFNGYTLTFHLGFIEGGGH